MKISNLFCCSVLLLSVLCLSVHAKTTTFVFEKHQLAHEWIYLDAFVFDSLGKTNPGYITWQLNNIQQADPTALQNLSIALYDDQAESWPALQNYLNTALNPNCSEVRRFAKGLYSLQSSPTLNIEVDEGNVRLWYLALDACDRNQEPIGKQAEYIELEFSWFNPGGFFEKQFSMDRQGILQVNIAFIPLYTIMIGAYIVSIVQLIRSKSFHLIIRVFVSSLVIYWLSRVIVLIHLLKYGSDGMGIPFFDDLSIGFKLLADYLFMVLLFLIASGWTITTSYIRYFKQIVAMWVFFGVFYIALFAWAQIQMIYVVSTEDYIYDTIPGVIIAIVRLPAAVFFLYVLFKTHREETNRGKLIFYKVVGILYGLWMISLPIIVSISFAIPQVHRAKWVEGISLTVDLLSYGCMVVILWYNLARKYFQLSQEDTSGHIYENL